MEKSDPTAATPDAASDPRYTGFFQCFNDQQYFEAHEVLEHLWLPCRDANRDFFKGLIQIAGAFVHLQKQFLRPDHPTDGHRLHPAVRLLHTGAAYLTDSQPSHLRLDVTALCRMCRRLAAEIEDSDFRLNPWHPARPPQIFLTGA